MSGRLDVVTVGESLVSFRSDGPLRHGGGQTARVAGAESNVAIGLARLGHRVVWVGRVGDDAFGALVLRELCAERVDTRHAVVDPGGPTGLMFVEERTADIVRVDYRRSGSAGSGLRIEDVTAALERRPRMLHLTGITPALSASARQAVEWAADHAASSGVPVSLDVNHRNLLWSSAEAAAVLAPLAARAAVVITSDDELALVAPGDEEEAVQELLTHGVEQVAVKRGARGASLYTAGSRHDEDALPVTAVDPIGAGDAFTAGLLSGWLDGLPPQERLHRAALTGAFAASCRGDWEGAPTRAELALLERHTPGSALR